MNGSFPGQEADAVARFPNMMSDRSDALSATGTADTIRFDVGVAQRQAQQFGRDLMRTDANASEGVQDDGLFRENHNPLTFAGLGDARRCGVKREYARQDSNLQPAD